MFIQRIKGVLCLRYGVDDPGDKISGRPEPPVSMTRNSSNPRFKAPRA